jgi:hypothetical protein
MRMLIYISGEINQRYTNQHLEITESNHIRIRQVLMELQRTEIGGFGIVMGCLRHA